MCIDTVIDIYGAHEIIFPLGLVSGIFEKNNQSIKSLGVLNVQPKMSIQQEIFVTS